MPRMYTWITSHVLVSLHFLVCWNVAVGDVLDEIHVWVVQHDMKVLYCMDGLQRTPVLEPDNLC